MAGRLYAGPGILEGALRPPVMTLASFFNIILFYFLNVASLWLAVSWSMLVASWYSKAWRLKLLTIDHDPRTVLGPAIAHDLELSCDGQQLGRRRMFNLYCKLFHSISFIFSNRSLLSDFRTSGWSSSVIFESSQSLTKSIILLVK